MTSLRTRGRRKQVFAAAFVSAALLGTAACGGGSDSKDEGGKSAAAGFDAGNNKIANPSAKKGGTLKFASVQDTDSWDTTRAYYGVVWNFMRYYSRQLVTNKAEPGKPGAEVTPDLATGLAKVSPTGRPTRTPCVTASPGRMARPSPPRTSSTASSASGRRTCCPAVRST